MQTYVVTDRGENILGENLTAREAMHEMLTHDGYAYEVRPADDGHGYDLWHSDGSRNSPRSDRHMRRTVICSLKTDEAEALEDIAQQVVRVDWPRMPTAELQDKWLADKGVM